MCCGYTPGEHPTECKEPLMPHGTWKTTGSGPGPAIVTGAVVVAGALAYAALRSFAAMLGDVTALALTAVIAGAAGWGAHCLALRLRGHRRPGTAQQPIPAITAAFDREHAIRAAPRRSAIAPAQVSNTYNFFGAGSEAIAARLLAEQRPPAPAAVRGEVER